MASPTQRIAELRGITADEVHEYCERVRAQVRDRSIRYKHIASALESLGADASIEEIAKEAEARSLERRSRMGGLHTTERRRHKRQSTPTKYPATVARIAAIRECSKKEAFEFCKKVQAWMLSTHSRGTSGQAIIKALELTGANASFEDVAEVVATLPVSTGRIEREWKTRVPSQRFLRPKFIIVDGVVELIEGWQKRAGVKKKR